MKDKESLVSILDDVRADLKRVSSKLSARDKALLDQHMTLVRSLEAGFAGGGQAGQPCPSSAEGGPGRRSW